MNSCHGLLLLLPDWFANPKTQKAPQGGTMAASSFVISSGSRFPLHKRPQVAEEMRLQVGGIGLRVSPQKAHQAIVEAPEGKLGVRLDKLNIG